MKRSIDQKLRLRNFDARNKSTETGAVVTNRRVSVVLKEDQENAVNGKQKDSVREETSVVSGTMRISVQNRHQKPIHPLNHRQKRMVEYIYIFSWRRKSLRGLSPSPKLGQPCRDHIKGKCTRPLVIIGIFPNVHPTRKNRDAISGISSRLSTGRLNINPAKNLKRIVTKVQWLY